MPLKVRYALIAVPVLMASLDFVENSCIAVMLWMWPDLSHGLVEVSSVATQVKIIAGEALMGAFAVIWLIPRVSANHQGSKTTRGGQFNPQPCS